MTSAIALGAIEIEAETKSRHAHIQLVHYSFAEPPDSALPAAASFRVELCLTGRHRGSRACFVDIWNPQRFERIGDLFLLPPDLNMRGKSEESSPLTSLVCHFDSEFILALFDELPALTDKMLLASLDIQDVQIRNLLLRLAKEVRHPGFASEILIDSIVMQTAVELFRIGAGLEEQFGQGGLAPWQLRLIDERLREGQAPTLSEIADLCRLSVRQLARGFKASRGCSIGSYVVNNQIERAKRLLASGESVASIANALGFSSPSNFCVAFRRSMGITPGEYRKQLM